VSIRQASRLWVGIHPLTSQVHPRPRPALAGLDSSRTTGIAKPTRRGLNSFLIVRGGLTGPSDDAVRAHEHGQDATRIESPVLDVNKKLHVFGRCGALAFAISAVDIALWDIAGKAATMPLCRLLGGGATELPCYASMVRYRTSRYSAELPSGHTDKVIGVTTCCGA
jgi:L-alanine-DL-glutamate epimerase-like enolase superfamily enzyme